MLYLRLGKISTSTYFYFCFLSQKKRLNKVNSLKLFSKQKKKMFNSVKYNIKKQYFIMLIT